MCVPSFTWRRGTRFRLGRVKGALGTTVSCLQTKQSEDYLDHRDQGENRLLDALKEWRRVGQRTWGSCVLSLTRPTGNGSVDREV